MILQSLYDLYDRLKDDPEYAISSPGYSLQRISFKVVLKKNGELHSIEDARIQSGNKFISRQIMVPGSTKSSGSGLNPGFLWDNTGYMLGYKLKDKNPKRSKKAFQSFKERHLALSKQITCPAYLAVCRFLEEWEPKHAVDHPVFNEVNTGFGVFQIIGQTSYVHDEDAVKDWWSRQQSLDENEPTGQCLITGDISSISRLHGKIKGIGDQAESLLVSFNSPTFESYGKEQSFNAPVSKNAAFRYSTSLNSLLMGPKSNKHRFSLADATVIFWTEKPSITEDIFAQIIGHRADLSGLSDVQDEDLRQKIELFLRALREGRRVYKEIDETPDKSSFFILGLTGQAKGRIGVRFFYRDTISHLIDNLRHHYRDMGIEQQFGEGTKYPDPEFPALWQILDETCPRKDGKPDREKISPILSGPLLRAVITGSQYPQGLYNSVIRRLHANSKINFIRASIIKGYLTRNQKKEVSMGLDLICTDPAYRLGRLFAVLEKTQSDALGDVGATIRDRFYSAASATPAAVFPLLLRTYQHHLAKKEHGKISREKLVREIFEPLKVFPKHLNLMEQGMFAIGYYHQMQDLWTSKKEHD